VNALSLASCALNSVSVAHVTTISKDFSPPLKSTTKNLNANALKANALKSIVNALMQERNAANNAHAPNATIILTVKFSIKLIKTEAVMHNIKAFFFEICITLIF
jgi:hypothetical protein